MQKQWVGRWVGEWGGIEVRVRRTEQFHFLALNPFLLCQLAWYNHMKNTKSVRKSELSRTQAGLTRWSWHLLHLCVPSLCSSPSTSKRQGNYKVWFIIRMASTRDLIYCFRIRQNSSLKIMKRNRSFLAYWFKQLLVKHPFGNTGTFLTLLQSFNLKINYFSNMLSWCESYALWLFMTENLESDLLKS